LVTLSFFADHAVWGFDPFGYHLTNLFFHVFNGILVFWMLSLLTRPPEGISLSSGRSLRGYDPLPLLGALIFVSHPAASEGVLSVGSRHELVMTFFYVSSVCFFLRSCLSKGFMAVSFFSMSVAAYVLSMLAKESGITVPAVILLLGFFHASLKGEDDVKIFPGKNGLWIKLLPFFAAAFLYIFVRFVKMVNPVSSVNVYFSHAHMLGGDYLTHLMTSLTVIASYVGTLVIPLKLSIEYVVTPVSGVLDPRFVLSLSIILSLAALSVITRKRCLAISFGWAWFFLTIFPVSNIPVPLPVIPMAERFIYLPSVGFAIFLAGVLCTVLGYAEKTGSSRLVRGGLAAVCMVVITLYSVRTVSRAADWQDSLTFWQKESDTEDKSFRTHNNLAMQYYYGGEKEKAIEQLKISLSLADSPQTRVNLGFVYLELGKTDDAEKEFLEVMSRNKDFAPAYYHLGLIEMRRGNDDRALGLFEEAKEKYAVIKDRPFEAETHNALGMLLGKRGMQEKAIMEYEDALKIIPDFMEARLNLGLAYISLGKYDKASEELKRVLSAEPENAEALTGLGYASFKRGFYVEAAGSYSEALKVRPEDGRTRYALAGTYLTLGMPEKAEKEYLTLLSKDPSDADSRNNLANIYYSRGDTERAVTEYMKILEEYPGHSRARNNLANVYLVTGRYEMAIDEYGKVIKADPNNAIVRYNLGLAYEGKGMPSEAQREFGEAIRIDPKLSPASEALRRVRGE
ncbi:MAG: tetratricopeptide repeat protein, partial [Candidatus Omnitrophica bacterium]|nr:tetratricopeptide repeat protein [Candidatus Omnitrophota bacterium]